MAAPTIRQRTTTGDAGGWIATHRSAVCRWLRFVGCPGELAEDIAHDTFVAALQQDIPDLGAAESAAWLRTTSRRRWIDHLRREGRRPEQQLDETTLERVWVEREGDDEGASYRAALEECLRNLSERERQALAMRYADRVKRSTMARRLSLSEPGVKALLRRIRERLRACVERRRQA